MKTTKTITVSAQEIIQNYICSALGITISEYNKKFSREESLEVFWDIAETGDHDKGTYKRLVRKVTITIEE